MGKKNPKSEEKKVRASDFSNFQTSDSRPTGLHQIFASFSNIAPLERNTSTKSDHSLTNKGNKSTDYVCQDTSESQVEFLTLLNKLTKKDSITKLKALETFNEIIDDTPEQVLEEFIVDLVHLFKKSTVVEPIKKIRYEFGLLLSKIANKLKKRLNYYLESFITHWWISMHDESPEIAEVYTEAFRNLFTSTLSDDEFQIKTLKILKFYFPKMSSDYLEFFNRNLDSYSKEWLDTFGKSSQSSASIADMHNRLFFSISRSLMNLFVYVRLHHNEVDFILDDLIDFEFVLRVIEVVRSSAFKKKLSCVLMLVEMIKVLPKEKRNLLETILSNAIACVKMETEPALLYHNVRLICACTRENSSCISKFLSNYDTVIISVLTNFNGEYGNKVDLYTLFPSLYMYLDPDYFSNNTQSFEKVLSFLSELMKKEVEYLRRNSYTFDLELFRNLGTRMLFSYYKLLLLSKTKSPHYVILPLKKLLPVTENSRDFLWNYPNVFSEFISELNLIQDQCFLEILNEILSFSKDSTVLIVSLLDKLFDIYGDQLNQVYVDLENIYNELINNVKSKLPFYLERHLEHRDDLTIDIDQMVHLLKKDPPLLPHHIPLLLFRSHSTSGSDFLQDYKLLLDVYKNLSSDHMNYWFTQDLDDRLLLFYSVVLLSNFDHNKHFEFVLEQKFDLSDRCTLFLVTEFVNGCKGLGLSNDLLQFSMIHLNLELLNHIFNLVEYSELTDDNKLVYQTLSMTYQLYENKRLSFKNKYPEKLCKSILTVYLYQVLRQRMNDFGRFCSFVLDELALSAESMLSADKSWLSRLEALPSNVLSDTESFTKNLGSLLGTLFTPDFVLDVLDASLSLFNTDDLKTLYKRSYHLVTNVYLKYGPDNQPIQVDKFLDVFIRSLVGHGSTFCVTAHADYTVLSTMYKFNEKETSEQFLKKMLTQFMEDRYDSVKLMEENVKMFKYFYCAFRTHIEDNSGLDLFLRSYFSENLACSHFLSTIYTTDTVLAPDLAHELQKFSILVSNMLKMSHSGKLDTKSTYTFINNIIMVSQLLLNYKQTNKLEKLKLDKMFELLSEAGKSENNLNCVPHFEHLDENNNSLAVKRDSSSLNSDNLTNLLPNTLILFLDVKLEDSVCFSWAYLSLLKFLSLFSTDLHNTLKNDLHFVFSSCITALYGSFPFHCVSANLLAALINFQVEQGFVSDFHLDVNNELGLYFKQFGSLNNSIFTKNFNQLKISNQLDSRSLTDWLAVCLKFGFECLKLDDCDLLSEFSRSVSLLLQVANLLQLGFHYVNLYVSHLWDCRTFYPSISESGVFCNFPNHEYVCTIRSFPEEDFFYDLNYCKLDFFKLLYTFNNYSSNNEEEDNELDNELTLNDLKDDMELTLDDLRDDDEENDNKEYRDNRYDREELEMDKVEETDEENYKDNKEFKKEVVVDDQNNITQEKINIEDIRNGYDLMKLYFSLIIGPYLTNQIMRTYMYLDTIELQEIEKCLISWLTVFNLHGKYKRMGNLNCANALVKLLTQKPHELGEYINDAFQENLAEAIQDDTDLEYLSLQEMNKYNKEDKEYREEQENYKDDKEYTEDRYRDIEYNNIDHSERIHREENRDRTYRDSYNYQENYTNNYDGVVDMSFIYSEQFNLSHLYPEEYYSREFYRNSLLDLFLQLLIFCLEKMLIKDQEFCQTVKLLYYKVAKIFPMQVSDMWNNCKNSYVKKNIKKFTKHEVTQKLIRDEIDTLKTITNDLNVFYDVIKREVTAKLLTKNEITAKISIKVPSAFPLEPLTFISQDNKKNHKWIIFSHSEANRSGIAQGLLLWYNNVVKYYQGIDECPICYSIVHTQFQSIPTKCCKVCKYKFHKECLFK